MSLILTDFEPKKTALSVESTLSGLSLSGSTEDSDNGQSYDRVAPRAQSHKIVATSNTDSMVKQSDDQESKITTNMISTWERKPHMLLVEDNAVNMKVLERLCNRLSLSYALAFNGLEAVKLFEADSSIFDIIWMDIMMPVMDGIAATKQIRDIEKKSGRYERKNRARIVALTGLSGEDIEKDAESVGFDAFWTKPVKLDLLRREVDRWAQVRERHEEQLSRNVSAESQQSSGSS